MSDKIYGPYCERAGYRVTVVRDGEKRPKLFSTESEALEYIKAVKEALKERDIGDLIAAFLVHLEETGTKTKSRETAGYRLRGILAPVLRHRPDDLLEHRCQALYREYRSTRAPDTHRGALSVVKAMFEWARKQKRVKSNPWIDVDPLDRKRRRKDQLRLDEARKLSRWCVINATTDDRALAVLIALVMGFRAHEVVGIEARDIDDDGTKILVDKSKTRAGERLVVLPAVLRGPLMKRAELRSGRLLPYQPRWVLDATKRACSLAGVPVVTAQGLRGTNATFSLEAGVAPEAVAKSLGHTNSKITRASYALPGAGRSGEGLAAAAKLQEPAAPRQSPATGVFIFEDRSGSVGPEDEGGQYN